MKRTKTAAQKIDNKQRQLVTALLKWFYRHARDLPWRHTRDPYAIWISEIMLQQTQVVTVIPYWKRWLREFPTIRILARARTAKLLKLWEGLGYYTRVRNLQKSARIIMTQHRGRFPEKFDEVLALPGVGRYTAGAICSIAFNQPAPVLDGNVTRVLTRVFGIRQNPQEKTAKTRLWHLAETLVNHASRTRAPAANSFRAEVGREQTEGSTTHCSGSSRSGGAFLRSIGTCSALNQALMEFGAVICTPRQPRCSQCPVRSLCSAHHHGLVDDLPHRIRRFAPIPRRFAAFVFTCGDEVLIRQRPQGVVNAQLWEFPNAEIADRNGGATRLAAILVGTVRLTRLQQIKHSITRHRITLEVFHAELNSAQQQRRISEGRWRKLSDLDKLPFPSAHRKIVDRLKAQHCVAEKSFSLGRQDPFRKVRKSHFSKYETCERNKTVSQ